MEKVIIQISDLHLFCNQKIKKVDIKCFVDCMKRFFNIDAEYYLVVCGDLTMDGTQNNCSFSLRLLEEIKRNIESYIKKQLNILIVPGNHDINLTKSNIDFRKLAELEKEGNIFGIEKLFISEANNEKHFLSICKQFDCFKDSYSIDFINNGDLNFVLINTSVFSSKIKLDKEHHHILTSEDFPFKTELNENGITLLVQHHRNDWFNYYSSQRIDEFAKKNVSICLYGHEHIGKDTIVKENDYPEILFIQSGEMKIHSNRLVGSFNILKIDKDNNYCDIFRYNYDKNNEMFIPDNAEGNRYSLTKRKKVFSLSETKGNDFYCFEFEDTKIDIRNIFEMPYLSCNNDEIADDISSIDDFVEKLSLQKRCLFTGLLEVGKLHY